MRTAIVSDLHLGAGNDSDLLRRPDARRALVQAVRGCDRLVLLGDVIELRDRPLAEAVQLAAGPLRELAGAVGELIVVPGNHDHRLVSGWLEQRALRSPRPLRRAERARTDVWPASALRVALGDDVPLRMHYPGIWVREDVYATHGHYLDRHLTIPTFERLGLALVERTLGIAPAPPDPPGAPEQPDTPHGPDDYERIVAPVYAFLFSLAQAGGRAGGTPSKRVWDALTGGESRAARLRGWLLGSVALPGAVTVANRLGLGPVRADLSPGAITRAGLAAMGEVVERLGIEANFVIFGHTHRRGPLPGEGLWRTPTGPLLLNTGSWVHSPGLLRESAAESPYWPGTVCFVEGDERPRLEHLLDDWTREELAG
ncbi:MAG TPA: metallophosphoesterase [Solirubrobacterales bacterium]|jgi:hypothetical protein